MRAGIKNGSIAMSIGLALLIATILGASGWSGTYPLHRTVEGPVTAMVYRAKDQSRLASMTAADDTGPWPAPIELAQAELPGGLPPMGGPFGHRPTGRAGPMGFSGFVPRGPAPSPRLACEEGIDRHAALAGYLRSKLRLQGGQVEAWQKIESAAAPAVETLRNLCAELPTRITAPPSMPDAVAYAEKRALAMAEFLRAIREPLRALYDTLSPDQRSALEPPPFVPPPHPM